MHILLHVLLLVVGFSMLVKGADWFVDGAAGIAERFGLSHLVIGLTIVAMGTSAPEAAVSLTAALHGNAGITIGNVVGSNILNILVILGIAAVITPIAVARSTIKIEIPFMILVTIALMIMGATGNVITFAEGAILWLLFVAYLLYLLRMAKTNKEEITSELKQQSIWKMILFTVIGMVLIIWGSDITVKAATSIAQTLGMSQRFIGLTIVALGTSLPELVTSIAAARKGEADIAIGNIVGSNIFNILFVVGTTALITPVAFEAGFILDTLICVMTGLVLWLFVFQKKKLSFSSGAIMLAGYTAYFVHLIG